MNHHHQDQQAPRHPHCMSCWKIKTSVLVRNFVPIVVDICWHFSCKKRFSTVRQKMWKLLSRQAQRHPKKISFNTTQGFSLSSYVSRVRSKFTTGERRVSDTSPGQSRQWDARINTITPVAGNFIFTRTGLDPSSPKHLHFTTSSPLSSRHYYLGHLKFFLEKPLKNKIFFAKMPSKTKTKTLQKIHLGKFFEFRGKKGRKISATTSQLQAKKCFLESLEHCLSSQSSKHWVFWLFDFQPGATLDQSQNLANWLANPTCTLDLLLVESLEPAGILF